MANTVRNIDKTINEIEIKTMANENNITYEEAKKLKENFASSIFDKIRNNKEIKNYWWFAIFSIITISFTIIFVYYGMVESFGAAAMIVPLFLGGVCTGLIYFYWGMFICIIRSFKD